MAYEKGRGWYLDTSGLNNTIDALTRVTGASQMTVLEFEVAAIMQKAMNITRAATVAGIKSNFDSKRWTTLHGKKYFLENLYSDALWAQIGDDRREILKRKLQRRGLSKRSWVLLAEAMGLTITAPGYVMGANVNGAAMRQNVWARRGMDRDKAFIEGSNASTASHAKAGGGRALQVAVNGRVKYFERNLAEGVFGSVDTIAKAYPGLIRASM